MEIGILVAAAVSVAAIASYYYMKNVRDSQNNAAQTANDVTSTIDTTANKWADNMDALS